jgi:putative ABC transport system permease protein
MTELASGPGAFAASGAARKRRGPSFFRTLSLAFRFSLREMRGGLKGFAVFLACIALGVGAIGGVNSVAEAITAGVADQGQVLLGGDLRFQLVQRAADPAERSWLAGLGTLSESAIMRSMARLPDGSDQALVDAKAVDQAYPLYGKLETAPQLGHDALFGERNGVYGAAAPDLLFDRLHLKPGDRITLGKATIELRARLVSEPDAVSEGFAFAPRLLISLDALKASGLVQPGSLVKHVYKIRLPDGSSE